jgi:hypothetical protein
MDCRAWTVTKLRSEKKEIIMNPFRFSKLLFVVLVFAFGAFQVAGTQVANTIVPPSSVATVSPTAALLPTERPIPSVTPYQTEIPTGTHVVAQWTDNVSIPQGAVIGFGSVWVPNHRSPELTLRIDPTTNMVIAVI